MIGIKVMDKVCEYCKVLRPVVYCKADSANLCLQCDAKIHSANALSNRHSRTLLCESCRCHWAYIQCCNHQMFMCRSCDRNQHNVSTQHQRRVISSYIGCPSASDLATLWGFDLNGLDDNTRQAQSFPTSGVSVNTGEVNHMTRIQSRPLIDGFPMVSKVDFVPSHSGAECEVGLRSRHAKAFCKGKETESSCFILQQILDLRSLQLSDGCNNPSFIHCKEQADTPSTENDSNWELENKLDQHLQYSLGIDSDFQNMENPDQDLDTDPFVSPFSQLDHLTSSTCESPSRGGFIWLCKTPVQSGQLWSKNMQDLGVCEDLGHLDELSMPDIDLTFRNFEELFGGGEQEQTSAMLDDDASIRCASMDKDISSHISEQDFASVIEESAQAEAKEIVKTSYKEKKVRRFEKHVEYASQKARDELRKRVRD